MTQPANGAGQDLGDDPPIWRRIVPASGFGLTIFAMGFPMVFLGSCSSIRELDGRTLNGYDLAGGTQIDQTYQPPGAASSAVAHYQFGPSWPLRMVIAASAVGLLVAVLTSDRLRGIAKIAAGCGLVALLGSCHMDTRPSTQNGIDITQLPGPGYVGAFAGLLVALVGNRVRTWWRSPPSG